MVITGPQKQEAPLGLLAGGQATELCFRNLMFSLKLPSSTWWGLQFCRRTQKNSKDIVLRMVASKPDMTQKTQVFSNTMSNLKLHL